MPPSELPLIVLLLTTKLDRMVLYTAVPEFPLTVLLSSKIVGWQHCCPVLKMAAAGELPVMELLVI